MASKIGGVVIGRILENAVPSILAGGSMLVVSLFAQASEGIMQNNDVSFSAAEIALIGVIASPIIAAVTMLFKSLLAAKDETIKIQQVEITAMQLRLNESAVRESDLQNKLFSSLTGVLQENRDTLHQVVDGVLGVSEGIEKLDTTQERRHGEFVTLMMNGDRRTGDKPTIRPNPGRRTTD